MRSGAVDARNRPRDPEGGERNAIARDDYGTRRCHGISRIGSRPARRPRSLHRVHSGCAVPSQSCRSNCKASPTRLGARRWAFRRATRRRAILHGIIRRRLGGRRVTLLAIVADCLRIRPVCRRSTYPFERSRRGSVRARRRPLGNAAERVLEAALHVHARALHVGGRLSVTFAKADRGRELLLRPPRRTRWASRTLSRCRSRQSPRAR